VPPPAARRACPVEAETIGAARRAVDGRERGAGTAARAHRGARRVGQDRHGAGHLAPGRGAAPETDRDLRDHGWFVFFAPRDNPEIAGVIFAEHSEHGYLASPIAKHVIETYFAKKEGRPLPVSRSPPGRRRARGGARRRPRPAAARPPPRGREAGAG
jgi:penicillin-binding protein 2